MTCLYRDEINSLQIQLSRTQAGPGRAVKEQQEHNSPNHVERINLISVFNLVADWALGVGKNICFKLRNIGAMSLPLALAGTLGPWARDWSGQSRRALMATNEPALHAQSPLLNVQRWDLIFADLVKQDPGRARQNS